MLTINLNLDGDGAFADLQDRAVVHAKNEPIRITTLDAGMTSGNPSVAIAIELEDGRVCFAETSVRLFQQAAAAMRGRYGDV